MKSRNVLAAGVGALLVLGIAAGTGFGGVTASENPLDMGIQDDDNDDGDDNDDDANDDGDDNDDDTGDEDEDDDERINLTRLQVTAQQAILIAGNESNGTVVELDLTTRDENESLVWKVELRLENGTEQEVLVDATDGTVLEVETGTDDAEREDDDDIGDDDIGDDDTVETETTTR